MTNTGAKGHAVVLGGSIAGLLAARVLAAHYERVTIVDKDRLAIEPTPRTGVPQGAHVHAVLARGLDIMETMFPGLTGELQSGGASLIGPRDVRMFILGWRKSHDSRLKVLSTTRPFLEWTLANRIRALPNVAIGDNTEAVGLKGSREKITGVAVRSGGTARDLEADFVVDARGRSSNLADWMKTLGLAAPPHETSPMSSVYSSYLLMPQPGHPRPGVLQVAKFEEKLGVLVFPVEGGRVLVSLGANAKLAMPKTHEEMLDRLKALPVPDAYLAIKDMTPLTPLTYSRFTASVRRNFDALSELPKGIVAIGDAIASFNPIFGQGMTVAALEAEWLDKCLRQGDPSATTFAKDYYAGIKPIVDLAWGPPDLEAKRNEPAAQPWGTRFLLWYTERMQATATRSAFVSKTIAEVQNMVAPPTSLFTPGMFFRVLFA